MILLVPTLKKKKILFQVLVGNLFQPWLKITTPCRLGMGLWSRMGGSTLIKFWALQKLKFKTLMKLFTFTDMDETCKILMKIEFFIFKYTFNQKCDPIPRFRT